jgi:hypothetical protein
MRENLQLEIALAQYRSGLDPDAIVAEAQGVGADIVVFPRDVLKRLRTLRCE